MSLVGLCETCCVLTDARKRWEETCIGRGRCDGCQALAPEVGQSHAVFKADLGDVLAAAAERAAENGGADGSR